MMYEVRDLGSLLIMLLVAPLFAVVLALSLVVVLPLALLHALYRWLCA